MKESFTSINKLAADGIFRVDAYQIAFINQGTADVEIFTTNRDNSITLEPGDEFSWSTDHPDVIDRTTVKIVFGSSGTKDLKTIRTALKTYSK